MFTAICYLALLVDTMRAAGADVQYISIPANGKWYDHIGIDSERRQGVYKKINHTVTSREGKLYDMTDKDYEPFVISDAVHIGWKGWVYINQCINHHMHEKPQQHTRCYRSRTSILTDIKYTKSAQLNERSFLCCCGFSCI